MQEKAFRKYYRRVAKEGILRSLLFSLTVGCVVLAVTEAFSWFFGFTAGVWIGPLLLVAVTAGLTPLLYFKKYRPTAKAIAARVDSLGLEERALTMTELENDASFIALKQREDTVEKLRGVDHMLLKVTVSAVVVLSLCVCGFLGVGTMTTEALQVAGVIPSGMELLSGETVKKTFYVSYSVEEGEGRIVFYTENQAEEQPVNSPIEVTEGENAPAVYAVANTDRNWAFVRWTDGLRDPYRSDLGITENISVGAVFAQLSDIDVDDPQLPPEMSPGPGESQDGDGEGGSGDQQPPDGEGGGDQQEEGGGSRNDANQQIYDGNSYYGDDYANAYDESMERLGSDDDLSDRQKSWIQEYFESIERSEEDE